MAALGVIGDGVGALDRNAEEALLDGIDGAPRQRRRARIAAARRSGRDRGMVGSPVGFRTIWVFRPVRCPRTPSVTAYSRT